MPTILLAEDETAIAHAVLFALRAEGWQAEHVLLGGEVLPRLGRGGIDLLILDVGLPDQSGFDVCRQLRHRHELPVIFLTARDGEVDRVLGLELGADDYVAKPFSPRELVARVRARLRRVTPVAATGWRVHGRFGIDEAGHRVKFDEVVLDLTRYEYGLLLALLARPGAVLTRAQLMDRVWEDAPESGDRTVDTHVKTVRAKLRDIAPASDPIRTVRGIGYAVEVGG
ncbi:MAG: two-component system response regulator CreB [Pseudomonadota bacterium]|nr:two-component system response regulator CreB [Pseudomonadota bacterium]